MHTASKGRGDAPSLPAAARASPRAREATAASKSPRSRGATDCANGSVEMLDLVAGDAASLEPAQEPDVRDAVRKSTLTRLPTRSRARVIRFPGAATSTGRGQPGLVQRPGGDGLDRGVVRLQDRERRGRYARELSLAREQGRHGLGPVGDDHDLRVDPLLPEEAPVLRVHDLRGWVDRDDRDRDLVELSAGSRRSAAPAVATARSATSTPKTPRRRAALAVACVCRARVSSASRMPAIVTTSSGERNHVVDLVARRSRNRAELRVAVCDRGRGSPTSTEPTMRPGTGLRTSTRSAR